MLKLKVILLVFIHWIRLLFFFFCQLLQSDEKIGSKILFSHKLGNALVEPLRFTSKKRNIHFDSFGQDGLKHLVIKDDKKLINKIMVCFEKFKLTEIRNLKFSPV